MPVDAAEGRMGSGEADVVSSHVAKVSCPDGQWR